MKRQLLFLMMVCLALAGNAQTYTDVITTDVVGEGLNTETTTQVEYTSETTGITYEIRCKLSGKDENAFHFNGSASGYQIWTTSSGFYVRKITITGSEASEAEEGTLRIYGNNTEWTIGSGSSSNFPNNVTSDGTSLGTIKVTKGEAVSLEVTKDYEYIDIYSSSTSGDGADFTKIEIEWETIDESGIECTKISPASGSTIQRDANTFTISFSGAVTMYNGEGYYDKDGTKNDDGDYQGSYFIDYTQTSGDRGKSYAAFATMSPEAGTYSDTWTVTINPDILAAWPPEEAEVKLSLITYAYTRNGTTVSTIFDEDLWCTASYTVAGDSWEAAEIPDMYTEYDVAGDEEYVTMDALRSIKIYCDAGISSSNYNFNESDNYYYHSPEDIYVINESGTTVTTCGNFEYIGNNCVEVTFAKAVKDGGNATIVIPAYTFALGEDTGNHYTTAYNEEYRVTVTVDGTQEGMLDYFITPADGSVMGAITEVTVTFDGAVEWGTASTYGGVRIYENDVRKASASNENTKEITSNGELIGFTFVFDTPVTTTGEYEFRIPENAIIYSESQKKSPQISAYYQVYEGMKSAGEVVVCDGIAYTVGDNGTAGVAYQMEYADYDGVNTAITEVTIPQTIYDSVDTSDGTSEVPYTVVGAAINAFRPYSTFDEETGNYQFNESCVNEIITKVTLEADITNYGWGVAEGNEVSGSTFAYCTALKEVVLGENVTTLAEGMFYDCTSLEEISFPEGVTELPASVIANCSTLSTVYIPSTCTAVGGKAFSNDRELFDIYCYAAVPPTTVATDSPTFNACTQAMTLHVGCDYVDDYTESVYWVAMGSDGNGYGINMVAVGYDCDEKAKENILAAVDELQEKADAVYQTAEEEYYTDDYIAESYETICGEITALRAAIEAAANIDEDTTEEYYAQIDAIDAEITAMSDVSESYNNYFTYAKQISSLANYATTITTAISQLGEDDSYGDAVSTIASAVQSWSDSFTEEAAANGELVYADTSIQSIIDDYYAQYAAILEAAEEEYYETTDAAISGLDTELAEVWAAIAEDSVLASDPEIIETYTALVARISALEEQLNNAKDNDELEETAEEIQAEIDGIQQAIDDLIKSTGITTGITTIDAASAAQKTIYTIAGQKVSNATKAGIYIIDGKKVIIK